MVRCYASLNEIGSTNTGPAVFSVDFSPDGTKIVSGLNSGTIKVWDSGAPDLAPEHRSSLPKTDAFYLPWQLRWISRRRRPTLTAIGSYQWALTTMGLRSSPVLATRRSKSGMQVCWSLKIAYVWPQLTPLAFPRSHTGA